jgi:hypothetical protein
MFTRLLIDGVLKIAQVIRYEHKQARVARIYDPKGTIPERIMDEVQENVFLDREHNQKFRLTPLGMSPIV